MAGLALKFFEVEKLKKGRPVLCSVGNPKRTRCVTAQSTANGQIIDTWRGANRRVGLKDNSQNAKYCV